MTITWCHITNWCTHMLWTTLSIKTKTSYLAINRIHLMSGSWTFAYHMNYTCNTNTKVAITMAIVTWPLPWKSHSTWGCCYGSRWRTRTHWLGHSQLQEWWLAVWEGRKGRLGDEGREGEEEVTCTLLLVTPIVCCAIPLTGMMLPWLSTASTLTSTFLSARLLPFSNWPCSSVT